MFSEPDTFALISKKGWRVLLALQLVVTCVRQGGDDWQEWSAVAVTEHQNIANPSGGLLPAVVSSPCGAVVSLSGWGPCRGRLSIAAPFATVQIYRQAPEQHQEAPEAKCHSSSCECPQGKGPGAKVFCMSPCHYTLAIQIPT